MWYFSAIAFVISSISCSSFGSDDIRSTSSIPSRQPVISSRLPTYVPRFFFIISLLILSIRSVYCRTDCTPPCLMLSFILISLVLLCLVLSCAERYFIHFLH